MADLSSHEIGQNKASVQGRLRSALANKAVADAYLGALVASQSAFNAIAAKLDADTAAPVVAVAELTDVTIQDAGSFFDVVGAGKAFTLHDGANAAHFVWLNVTDGTNGPQTAPALSGTGHQVDVLSADTAAQIGTKVKVVLAAVAAFSATTNTSAVIHVVNTTAGAATDAAAGTAHVAISVTQQGVSATAGVDVDFESSLAISSLLDPESVVRGQNLASIRKVMQSALANRVLANELLDSVAEIEVALNALMIKLDAEAGTLASTDFASTLSVSPILPDVEESGAQYKASMRKALASGLANARLADEILDAISSLQANLNAMLLRLDGGSVSPMADLAVDAIDPSAEG